MTPPAPGSHGLAAAYNGPVEWRAADLRAAAWRLRSRLPPLLGAAPCDSLSSADLWGLHRLRVVYRLVGGVLLMGVVRRGACLGRLPRLLGAAPRH